MNRITLALILACFSLAAAAQVVIPFTGSVCNVAQSVCTLTDEDADASLFGISATGAVTLSVTDESFAQTIFTGPILILPPTTDTLYLRIVPFTVTLTPPATLYGNLRYVRSGSGRGGWTWHKTWAFSALVVG